MYKCDTSIAILLATYNSEKFLAEQIDSILNQTCKDWTLYIRDDASLDNTQEIIDKYTSSFPDKIIQIDRNTSNLGCQNNFYRLLELVDADYYMFADADDIWLSTKVETSKKEILLKEYDFPNKPILAYCDSIVCDENLTVLANSFWETMHLDPRRLISFEYMAVCCTAAGACSILNRAVKELLFPIEHRDLMYDYWIALLVSKHGIIHIIDQPLRYYRLHNNNVCGVDLSTPTHKLFNMRNFINQIKKYNNEIRQLKRIGYKSSFRFYYIKLRIFLMRRSIF